MHTSMCMKYPLLFPSLSLSLRCAIFHEMVVDKQRRYEISIVPAIKNDNITVIAWMYVTLYYRTAVHPIRAVRCEDLAAEERIF